MRLKSFEMAGFEPAQSIWTAQHFRRYARCLLAALVLLGDEHEAFAEEQRRGK